MKLASVHKPILFILLIGMPSVWAQEAWTLRQCLDTAQSYNKTLRINRNIITLGIQREEEAKANLIPKISVNADYKYFLELPTQLMPLNALNPTVPEGQFRDLQFGVPHNIGANVQLTVPLYNSSAYSAIRIAGIASEILELQYQKAREQVAYDVTILYYNAQILRQQLYFLDSNLINIGKLFKNMALLKEHQMVRGSDVNRAKLQSEHLAVQRENINSKYIQILNMLKLNMGIPLEKELSIDDDISFQPTAQYAQTNNADILIIRRQNTMLNAELDILNNSFFLPSLNLIASYGATGFGYDKEPNNFLEFHPIGFAGIQLAYPLFDGTITQRKISQKKLEIKNNDLQEQLVSDRNKIEVKNAERQKILSQKNIVNIKYQIDLAQTIYNQTLLQQEQGIAGLSDILLADNTLRETQQNYLAAVFDYLKSDLELQRLLGIIISNR